MPIVTPSFSEQCRIEHVVNGWMQKQGNDLTADAYEYHFTRQGNFTIAVVTDKALGVTRVGVAKRNASDKSDSFRGKVLATLRAFENRPVTAAVDVVTLTDSIKFAMNSGDGSYHP